MTSVKIFGAGSIGNHLAHAARAKGWSVTLCDVDPAALERTREDIYPTRYGAWDEVIETYTNDAAPKGGFDFIFVGTPPDSHISLALAALEEGPRAVLVEKPFATPDLAGCQELYEKAARAGVRAFVGYDHIVARSTGEASAQVQNVGDVQAITVLFREHWKGIFNAHPWLDGPADTYLGYWERGGGALGEHSHATNLWQHFAHTAGAGRVCEVTANLDYVEDARARYDRIAMLHLKTEQGLIGDVVQDVVTLPPHKSARIQGTNGAVEWQCRASPYMDFVRLVSVDGVQETPFEKTRPDDFIQELDHMEQAMEGGPESPISIERGLDTMLVIAAGHLSARTGRKVEIDWSRGYRADALQPVQ
ncbi:MAG: Gfo/Idh/MocA family oxidoreductase [Rhodospirillales bacterium]|nr:Gfo/Idh/MocA family oxidoreductase [Rhodospirillales bacterium]